LQEEENGFSFGDLFAAFQSLIHQGKIARNNEKNI